MKKYNIPIIVVTAGGNSVIKKIKENYYSKITNSL